MLSLASNSSFRKIQILEFTYSALSLFLYSLFKGYRTEETDCCDTGYVHFSSGLFISFRFVTFVSFRKIQ